MAKYLLRATLIIWALLLQPEPSHVRRSDRVVRL